MLRQQRDKRRVTSEEFKGYGSEAVKPPSIIDSNI